MSNGKEMITRVIFWALSVSCFLVSLAVIYDKQFIAFSTTIVSGLLLLPPLEAVLFFKNKITRLRALRVILATVLFFAGVLFQVQWSGLKSVNLSFDNEPASILSDPHVIFLGNVAGHNLKLFVNGKAVSIENNKFSCNYKLTHGNNRITFTLEGYSKPDKGVVERIERTFHIRHVSAEEVDQDNYQNALNHYSRKEYDKAIECISKIPVGSKYSAKAVELKNKITWDTLPRVEDEDLERVSKRYIDSFVYEDVFNKKSVEAKKVMVAKSLVASTILLADKDVLILAEWQLAGDYAMHHSNAYDKWPKTYPIFIQKFIEIVKSNRKLIERSEYTGEFYAHVHKLLMMKESGSPYERSISSATIDALKSKNLWKPLKDESWKYSKEYWIKDGLKD